MSVMPAAGEHHGLCRETQACRLRGSPRSLGRLALLQLAPCLVIVPSYSKLPHHHGYYDSSVLSIMTCAGRLKHADYVVAHKALEGLPQQSEQAQQWRSHCQQLFPRSSYFQS